LLLGGLNGEVNGVMAGHFAKIADWRVQLTIAHYFTASAAKYHEPTI
jgi:hypothetical protein